MGRKLLNKKEVESLKKGTKVISCTNGKIKTIGIDKIDLDTRMGLTVWSVLELQVIK